MKLKWDEEAWSDYLYWQKQDKKTLKKINTLLNDAGRNPFKGIGKPEPLKHRQGYWSRRIDEKNRVIYKVEGDSLIIAAVRGHYNDK
jgi:toxin YoeB